MKGYGSEDLQRVLAKVGCLPGDVVLVHAALWALGQFADCAPGSGAEAIANLLVNYFGAAGTVVVPTFSYSVCKTLYFDRATTPSEGMGILAETLRGRRGTLRSPHPLQSVAATGKWAEDICCRDTPGAFNPGGPFDRMVELNAKLVLLGTSMQAASLIHYVEERYGVPYRYWKSFTITYADQGIVQVREYRMFVRDLDLNPLLDLSILAQALRKDVKLRVATLGSGQIASCTFADFCAVAGGLLAKDPCALLSNREQVVRALNRSRRKGCHDYR